MDELIDFNSVCVCVCVISKMCDLNYIQVALHAITAVAGEYLVIHL